MTHARHAKDCDFHLDQYTWECNCGAIAAAQKPRRMTSFTYRIEDPDDYEGELASVFSRVIWAWPLYLLMKDGRDVNWSVSREAARAWCDFQEKQTRCG